MAFIPVDPAPVAPPHPAIVMSDWWQWEVDGAAVVDTPSGVMRRSAFGDVSFTIDNSNVVGLALTLSEAYRSDVKMDGLLLGGSSARVGSLAILAPGHAVTARLEGDARFLLLGLSLPDLREQLARDMEANFDSLAFDTALGVRDPAVERALLKLSVAAEDELDDALLDVGSALVLGQSSLRGTRVANRLPCLRPTALRRVLEMIEDDIAAPLHLTSLASTAGISAFHFAREFHRATGLPPRQYIIRRRVERAVNLLAIGDQNVEQVARTVGFNRGSHLARHMRSTLGLSPTELIAVVR